VGGQAAQEGEYPWQVALVPNGEDVPYCGGSLITSRTVLTAAHCGNENFLDFKVVVGKHQTNFSGEKFSPGSWTSHPEYDPSTYDNDFAIITLESPVTFSDSVRPVCLPSPSSLYEGVEATVTGWGTLQSGGIQPEVLQEVDVDTMSNEECTKPLYVYKEEITENMICAAAPGKDSCQGDSGGPLIAKKSGTSYFDLIGVVSWGYGCARPNSPGVYSRITQQLDWINEEKTGEDCPSP